MFEAISSLLHESITGMLQISKKTTVESSN